MARKGAMGRDPKAGGGRASVGRDPIEMRRYQEAANRAQRLDPNSEAYASNKAILEQTGAKYGLNWQKSLAQGYKPPLQQDQRPIQQTPWDEWQGQLPPQASANNQGQFRLSPGVYGTREQAQNQYDRGGITPYSEAVWQGGAFGNYMADPNRLGSVDPGHYAGGTLGNLPSDIQDGMYRGPQDPNMPQQDMTPNAQGKYRLSPGVYGTQQQARSQYDQRMQGYNAAQEARRAAAGAVGQQGQRALVGDYYRGMGGLVGNYYGGMGNMVGQGTEDLTRTWNDKVGKPIGSVVSAPAKAYKKVFGW